LAACSVIWYQAKDCDVMLLWRWP